MNSATLLAILTMATLVVSAPMGKRNDSQIITPVSNISITLDNSTELVFKMDINDYLNSAEEVSGGLPGENNLLTQEIKFEKDEEKEEGIDLSISVIVLIGILALLVVCYPLFLLFRAFVLIFLFFLGCCVLFAK